MLSQEKTLKLPIARPQIIKTIKCINHNNYELNKNSIDIPTKSNGINKIIGSMLLV